MIEGGEELRSSGAQELRKERGSYAAMRVPLGSIAAEDHPSRLPDS
jgi:hypothetical protein